MAQYKWQAITATNIDQDLWRHVASLGLNELKLTDIISQYLTIKVSFKLNTWAGVTIVS